MAGESVRIKGDVVGYEDVRFEGQIEGTISVPEHTLILGPQSRIVADVQARAIVAAGTIEGAVTVRESFELKEEGNLEGTLQAPLITVREGAFLRATITMPEREAEAAVTRKSPFGREVLESSLSFV
jgi:cytoskeletal protein CcmA (bactofilin family)